MNLGCLGIIVGGLLTLFIAYPIITHTRNNEENGHPLGVNATGQVPEMTWGNRGLIDEHTPQDALKKKDWNSGKEWNLIFSDEFNVDGRSFYPGDDPVSNFSCVMFTFNELPLYSTGKQASDVFLSVGQSGA